MFTHINLPFLRVLYFHHLLLVCEILQSSPDFLISLQLVVPCLLLNKIYLKMITLLFLKFVYMVVMATWRNREVYRLCFHRYTQLGTDWVNYYLNTFYNYGNEFLKDLLKFRFIKILVYTIVIYPGNYMKIQQIAVFNDTGCENLTNQSKFLCSLQWCK